MLCAHGWVRQTQLIFIFFRATHFTKEKTYNYFFFCKIGNPLRKNQKQKPARIPPQTPPPRGQNAKTKLVSVLRKSISPENSFRKTESELKPRHTARILGGKNPERKTPFPFSKEIHPRQNRKARSVFSFGVAEALRGGGGTIHSRSKKVRANDIMTPPGPIV